MLAALGGFALRYLPNLFGWIGDFFGGREEDRRQEKMLNLQIKLEEKRQEMALKGLVVQAEITEALAALQAELASINASMQDRKSAREYGTKVLGLLAGTLKQGKDLGVSQGWLNVGWIFVLGIEAWSASIQPLIATIALGMWATWKIAAFYAALQATGGLAAAVLAAWGFEDWLFVEAVLGFFLAGRVMKWQENKRVRTATGD